MREENNPTKKIARHLALKMFKLSSVEQLFVFEQLAQLAVSLNNWLLTNWVNLGVWNH